MFMSGKGVCIAYKYNKSVFSGFPKFNINCFES